MGSHVTQPQLLGAIMAGGAEGCTNFATRPRPPEFEYFCSELVQILQ